MWVVVIKVYYIEVLFQLIAIDADGSLSTIVYTDLPPITVNCIPIGFLSTNVLIFTTLVNSRDIITPLHPLLIRL